MSIVADNRLSQEELVRTLDFLVGDAYWNRWRSRDQIRRQFEGAWKVYAARASDSAGSSSAPGSTFMGRSIKSTPAGTCNVRPLPRRGRFGFLDVGYRDAQSGLPPIRAHPAGRPC